MLTVDVDEGMAADVGHAGTAEHLVEVAGTHSDGGVAGSGTFVAAAIYVAADGNLRKGIEH